MKKPRMFFVSVALVVAFALLSLACSGVRQAAQRQQTSNDLKQIGLAYHNYCDAHRKGPSNADDLLPHLENNTLLVQKMKSDYTIIWGVNLTDMTQFPNGLSNTVLGYETNASSEGGVVLMCDAATIIMTASEFNGKTKAKGSGGK